MQTGRTYCRQDENHADMTITLQAGQHENPADRTDILQTGRKPCRQDENPADRTDICGQDENPADGTAATRFMKAKIHSEILQRELTTQNSITQGLRF